MIKWLFPAPMLSLVLVILWLVLSRSVSTGNVLLAACTSWLMPWLFAPLRPEHPRVRRPWVILRLLVTIGCNTIRSNIEILTDLIWGYQHPPHACFIHIPLDLRDPTALACLCSISIFVPGSLWCELAPDKSMVIIHAWKVTDKAQYIVLFKQHYELPLMQIFEGKP